MPSSFRCAHQPLTFRTHAFYAERDIDLVLGARVTAVRTGAPGVVETQDGRTLTFDRPEALEMRGHSDAFELFLKAGVVALRWRAGSTGMARLSNPPQL